MKKITSVLILTAILVALFVPFSPILAQAPDEEELPKPLGFYESLEKWGVVERKEIPRDKWPPIPPPTRPEFLDDEVAAKAAGTYQAGIRTGSGETWYGLRVAINGNAINNNNPGTNYVRLTPHVMYKDNWNYDYIAVVLEATSSLTELQLWTFHKLGSPQYEFEGTVNKTSWYEYSLYIDTSNNFQIYYRSYPSGSWQLLRTGSLGWRRSTCSPFLEHIIYSGNPGEHGYSYWQEMVLFDSNGNGYWWTQTPTSFAHYPLRQTNWLEGGWNRRMNTWSQY